MRSSFPTVLVIGVSDPSGTDGVEADLKTLAAFGVHGACVITGIQSAGAIAALDTRLVEAQLDAALGLFEVQAVKTGGLGKEETARSVAARLAASGVTNIVVDPADFGSRGAQEARASMKSDLLPHATVVAASIEEASAITGVPVRNAMGMKACAKLIKQLGAGHVVVTGGRFEDGVVVDYLFDGSEYMDMPSELVEAEHLRGMGATYSSAIAAGLAHGRAAEEAVAVAKMFVTDAANDGLGLRDGSVTPNPVYAWWAAGGDRGYGA